MEYVKGLVSIVIPTFRRSDMLSRAIESVLNQTYRCVECIVVNDNNPGDEFSRVLYSMLDKYSGDERFRFVEQEVHKNGAAARNAGIKVAKGEYIAFLDDDDFWDANKVEVQVSVLNKLSEDWGAVSCLMRFYRKGELYSANVPYKDGAIHFEVLTRSISMGTGSLIIRRKALDKTGYFDENLRRYQDPQLFSCLTEQYKVKLIKRYLHNRDVDDAQNRPTIKTINEFQDAFFLSVTPQFNRMSKRRTNIVKTIYIFEKAPIYWRSGDKLNALKCAIGVCKYPETLFIAIKRTLDRYKSRIFIDCRIKKYS